MSSFPLDALSSIVMCTWYTVSCTRRTCVLVFIYTGSNFRVRYRILLFYGRRAALYAASVIQTGKGFLAESIGPRTLTSNCFCCLLQHVYVHTVTCFFLQYLGRSTFCCVFITFVTFFSCLYFFVFVLFVFIYFCRVFVDFCYQGTYVFLRLFCATLFYHVFIYYVFSTFSLNVLTVTLDITSSKTLLLYFVNLASPTVSPSPPPPKKEHREHPARLLRGKKQRPLLSLHRAVLLGHSKTRRVAGDTLGRCRIGFVDVFTPSSGI